MQVNELAPQETERFRDKVRPVVEQLARDLDQEVVQAMYGAIDRARTGQ